MIAVLLAGLLGILLGLQKSKPIGGLSESEFQEAFEQAFDADDLDRVEALIQENPTRFVPLFENYVEVWVRVQVEPRSEELLAVERARVLAEGVDSALNAPGLLQQWEALDDFDAGARQAWRQAGMLYRAGISARGRGDLDHAKSSLEKAARAFERVGNTIGRARALITVGIVERKLGHYDDALLHTRHGLSCFESIGDPRFIAKGLVNLGLSHKNLGQIEEAVDLYKRGLVLSESLGLGEGAGLLNNLGNCYFELGKFEKAVDYHERSLGIKEPVGDPQDIAVSLNNLGMCYRALGQIENAIEVHARALSLLEPLGKAREMAFALNNLGNCYRHIGEFEQAIKCDERALALKEPLGNPRDIASSLANLGIGYRALGQLERAIECHQRALALRAPLENRHDDASSLAGLGSCYEDLGQFEKAIEYHQRALEIQETLGNSKKIASSINNLGNSYRCLGRFEKAIQHHERALALRETLGNPLDIAYSLNNLGVCYVSLGQFKEAIEYHERALALKQPYGNPKAIGASFHNLGTCYRYLGEFEKAMEYHERALALKESVGNPQSIAESLGNIGHCHFDLGRFDQAIRYYRKALESLRTVSLRSLSERERSGFRQLYGSWLTKSLDAARRSLDDAPLLAEAFWISESMRSQSLLEALDPEADVLFNDADPALQSRRRELLAKLETKRLDLAKALADPAPDRQVLEEELGLLESELTEVTGKLRRSSPRFAELTIPEPAGIHEIRQHVLASERALLHYVLGATQSYLWLLTDDDLQLFPLAPEAELRASYQMLSDKLLSDQAGSVDFVNPARRISEALLGPVMDSIQEYSEVIVVADGFLGFLPFEVLLVDEPESQDRIDFSRLPYLIRDKTITYAPSASFLVFHAQQNQTPKNWKKDALLLGDPVYVKERTESVAMRSRPVLAAESFDRLRMTREEVTSIARELIERQEAALFFELQELPRSGSLQGSRFDLYVGNEVHEERLKSDLTGYRILHLATHGYFDPEYPWFSGLVLSSAEESDEEDSGFLNLLELATLKLDSEIVFLSACETGKGEVLYSEGIQSTARSFLIAGAQSVIATQWSVRDDVASAVARGFYHRLFAGTPPGEALRSAKLSIIDGGARGAEMAESTQPGVRNPQAHPSVWAPFVLFGG